MKTIRDVFTDYKRDLSALYNENDTEAITRLAIGEITSFSNAKIKAFPESELSTRQSETLEAILTRLKTGEPIQYILGKTEFYGLPFSVNPSVLIPRPETEELVAWVIETARSGALAESRKRNAESEKEESESTGLKAESGKEKAESGKEKAVGSILDIGTGSGCIAISLKKNLPAYKVSAIDISKEALETAKGNAKLNEVDVEFIYADILNVIRPLTLNHSPFTSIISNPPYVTLHDKIQMHTNVVDFEPHTALFAPESDPLIFYKAIADFAITQLAKDGLLFLEINESLGADMVELLTNKGFKNIELRKDMSGKDRMMKANV